MGTKGSYGFRKGGVDKIQYVQYDSNPMELGKSILEYAKRTPIEVMEATFDFMEAVNQDVPPTPEQIEKCKPITNLSVSTQKTNDWYCLLREGQGDLAIHTHPTGIPYFIDSSRFMADSLFCEWAYLINLDEGTVEIYQGFNHDPNAKGRYAALSDDENAEENGREKYYGVKLIATLDGADVQDPSFDVEAYVKALEAKVEAEVSAEA